MLVTVGKGTEKMTPVWSFTVEEARRIGELVDIEWGRRAVQRRAVCRGLEVELEHGLCDPSTNVTDDDAVVTGKIALADLNEFADSARGSSGWMRRPSASSVTDAR
jgi:hypothetical protein